MYKIIGANQAEYGPITAEQLRQWIAEGRVNAQTLAQAEGETGWKPISSFPEFAASFPAASAASPTPPPGGFAGAPQSGLSDSGRATAKSQMAGPAIALMVIGGLGILGGLVNLVSALTGAAIGGNQFQPLEQQNPQLAHMMQSMQGTMGVVVALISIALWILVVYSAVKMKNLQNHGLCIAGSIVAMLPCSCCCCIGLPIGIWALVMLNKPEIKAYFT